VLKSGIAHLAENSLPLQLQHREGREGGRDMNHEPEVQQRELASAGKTDQAGGPETRARQPGVEERGGEAKAKKRSGSAMLGDGFCWGMLVKHSVAVILRRRRHGQQRMLCT